jgi:SecD/SecF fusion protein
MSTRLFYVLAAVAVVFTVAGVLVFQSRRSSGDDSAFGGKADPVLEAKVRGLAFYDWEANVIGPDGRPAPGDPRVTGGPRAGRAGAISMYDAVLRAARRPAEVDADNARAGSIFFAADRATRKVRPGASTAAQALRGAPAGARVYEVRPGTAIVAAESSASRFYVLRDDVAITGSEIRNPRQGTDARGRPVTLFEFTDAGVREFRALTKAIAARGSQESLNRVQDDPALHDQHFAVVYLGQVLTAPAVDFRRSPDGLDASAGTQLAEQLP